MRKRSPKEARPSARLTSLPLYPETRGRGAISRAKMLLLPKFLSHEHLDCSPRPETVIELASQIGFDKFTQMPFPKHVIKDWSRPDSNRRQLALDYQHSISMSARQSLANYLRPIGCQLLPVMQTAKNLYRITKERIEDAIADGIVCMNLRFAPQLHIWEALSLNAAVEAVIGAVEEADIPVTLTLCCLRHEPEEMFRKVADTAIRYKHYVRKFDLAGDEKAYPGVRTRWLKQAMRVADNGIFPTIHIAETNSLTREDIRRLKLVGVEEIDHGFRDDLYTGFTRTICITSNIITGQVPSFACHNADELYRDGVPMTLCTDGTLMTMTDLTNEYMGCQHYFGWGLEHFYRVNMTALRLAPLPKYVKDYLREKLDRAYLPSDKQPCRSRRHSGGGCGRC